MSYKEKYEGLTAAQVEASRSAHGVNRLTPPVKVSPFRKFLRKFADPLIIVLIVAGSVSLIISFFEFFLLDVGVSVFLEPVGIIVAILLATGLAFFFEYRADRQFAILNKVSDEEPAVVVRGGQLIRVSRIDIVVDDIIVLSAGDEIPADAELLEAASVAVDESSLTGEPLCRKCADRDMADPEATYPSWILLKGTKLVEGHCVARVSKVGNASECGKVQHEAQIDNSVRTPLDEQLAGLSSVLTKAGVGVAIVIFILRFTYYLLSDTDGINAAEVTTYFLKTLMTSVSVIAMAVPEGLPMSVTLSLAYSMRRMLSTNNLVRKMHACETMGATTVICTDKTGTLTANRMSVGEAVFFCDGNPADNEIVRLSLAVNASAELDTVNSCDGHPSVIGNPTEGALLLYLYSQGADYRTVRNSVTIEAELPFSQVNKYMATIVRAGDGRRLLLVKGAPEIVRLFCSDFGHDGGWVEVELGLLSMQSRAMRTLGFAYAEISEDRIADVFDNDCLNIDSLSFLGYVGIADPMRPDVPNAIETCQKAGIDVIIVTGDSKGVATEIGRQIGLVSPDADIDKVVISGPDFAALSDDDVAECINGVRVIARARPMDKKRLVEALQAKGHVVAVTGDGTNDAPAMKAAHVGLSMGVGTATAKEASDITIIDNSFVSIGRAVLWGRSLYKNIQRFILFQMTVNISACLIMLIGVFFSSELPLSVTQILWVNLIMDTFAAVALASLPPAKSVMKDKPRNRKDFIISRAMAVNMFVIGCLLTGVLLCFYHILLTNEVDSLINISDSRNTDGIMRLTPYEAGLFFNVFVMVHFWNMFNARAFQTGRSAFHLLGCKGFLLIAFLIVAGQVFIVQFGGAMFGTAPLAPSDWILSLVLTFPVLLVGEIVRFFCGHKQ